MNKIITFAVALVLIVLGGMFALHYKIVPYMGLKTDTAGESLGERASVEERARETLEALKARDGSALSTFAHPSKGIRFSPYGYISTSTDVVIMAGGLSDIYAQAQKETWGSYDGSGEPIVLSFAEYDKKFIYDLDFLSAPQKATNTILGTGNSLVNITEVYPEATFVEYYFPGIDPQYQGMDWRSLRLIFEQVGDTWYLVGIAHDQWTI